MILISKWLLLIEWWFVFGKCPFMYRQIYYQVIRKFSCLLILCRPVTKLPFSPKYLQYGQYLKFERRVWSFVYCEMKVWTMLCLYNYHTVCITNSSPPPCAAYMHRWTGSVLVQIMACSVPNHYLNQCWLIVNWALRNTLQWNSNWNRKLFIHENVLENVVCEMAAILSSGRWVKL